MLSCPSKKLGCLDPSRRWFIDSQKKLLMAIHPKMNSSNLWWGSHAWVPSYFSHVWLLETLWAVVCQAPLSMVFSRQEWWSRLPCPPPGDLPKPGIEPMSPVTPTLQVNFLPLSHRGKPKGHIRRLNHLIFPDIPQLLAMRSSHRDYEIGQ